MRRLILSLLLGLPLGLTALTACGDDGDPQPVPAHETGSPAVEPTAYENYVAIGDSYTAAPLVPPTDTSTVCLRSGVNYPALVTKAMPGTHLTDVSCSGAKTLNLTQPQKGRTGSVPPQLEAVRPSTDLVTIGLGGNDDDLFATLLGGCTQLASSDPQGGPCTAKLGAKVAPTLTDVRGNVEKAVRLVQKQAPDARVLLIGYPQIVPASGTCRDLPLATRDYAFGRRVNEGLNQVIQQAAKATDVEYVDLWGPTEGHDICGDEPWINGRVTSAERALAYHPLAAEQQHVAELVVDHLRAK